MDASSQEAGRYATRFRASYIYLTYPLLNICAVTHVYGNSGVDNRVILKCRRGKGNATSAAATQQASTMPMDC